MKKINQKYITSMPVLLAITVVLAICTILNFVMMQKAINEKIENENAYYQISAEEPLFEDYDFYLLVVVSREKTKTDFVWTYGLQMLDDNSDTAYVDSDKLFSIGEHIVAIELNDNSVILIDLS